MPILKDVCLDADFALDKAHCFRLECRHIAALVSRNLPRIKTSEVWRIWLTCKADSTIASIKILGGVLYVDVDCDPTSFFTLTHYKKKQFALKAISQGLALVANTIGVGKAEFERAIEKSKSLLNEWSWPKASSSSPDRKWKAHLWCIHEIDHFTANLVIQDKQKTEVARDIVFKTPPSEFEFAPLLATPAWLSATEIAVGDQIWHWDADKRRLKKQR